MIICGQKFSPELIGRIQAKIDTHPGLSRRKLSQQICEWLDWRNPRGDLKQMSCRVALLRLHEQGHIRLLPLCGASGPPPKSNSKAGWESFKEPPALIRSLAERLVADWLERYGVEPVLLETFVERDRFKGTCYRAANWQHIGETKGRGRQDQHRKNHVAIKDIYMVLCRIVWVNLAL